ncbi:MAG: DUF4124 domain-containing protein [Usitatibacter sp.]
MKSLIILALALGVATTAGAQLYKYVDKDGKTVYTDQPPVNLDSKQINSGGRSTSAPAPAKTALERDKELDKGRKEVADKAKKAGDESEKSAQMEQRCGIARSNYQMYSEGGRIQKTNDKGERELMNDAEIVAARDKARRDMEEACKK